MIEIGRGVKKVKKDEEKEEEVVEVEDLMKFKIVIEYW